MAADEGELPAHSPLGSRTEQHVINDKLDLKAELKKARDERDERFRFRALVGAFVTGFIVCDLMYGGRNCHRLLLWVDSLIHQNPYD
jgi:hypothetical protein